MASVHFSEQRPTKHVMITDLDETDTEMVVATNNNNKTLAPPTNKDEAAHRKATKKRKPPEKILQTLTGNFSRRSRSAEAHGDKKMQTLNGGIDKKTTIKNTNSMHSYFNELLQSKDKQMDKLLQRLSTVHKFNEQFAAENTRLQDVVNSLDGKLRTLRKQIADCSQCQKLSHQLEASECENRTHEADVAMMKTLVYRLNVQIEYYQDQLRLKDVVQDGPRGSGDRETDKSGGKSNIATWTEAALHTHTLTPLLKAYDEMIRDKEDLLGQYQKEFDHFTGELKRTIDENNRLLQHNESLRREVDSWRDERTRITAQLDVCRAKAEAQTKKSDLAKEKLVEVMQCYEQKVQSLSMDLNHLQSAYARCKAELMSLKSVMAQPKEGIATSLQECKELLEQLKEQHSREKHSLEHTIGEQAERQRDTDLKYERLRQAHDTLQRDTEHCKEECKELKARMATVQRSAERVKKSRDRLKARLRIALQWAQKLEEGQNNLQNTWEALKRLETIVKHKESQVRGLHSRHLQEIDKMEKKLAHKEETIRTILKGKLARETALQQVPEMR